MPVPAREDVKVVFENESIAAWIYRGPQRDASHKGPALVLAHGLGGTRDMRLDVFAGEFQVMGYSCVVFDYRCHGDSTGLPRRLIDWSEQQKDWHAMIEYTRGLPFVDPDQVGLFGTSFSGGHVIQLGAADKRIKAIVSQCPFTDGLQSAFCTGFRALPGLLWLGFRDFFFGTKTAPVVVDLTGSPGDVALMNAHDAIDGYVSLIPDEKDKDRKIPARIIAHMPFLRPGSYASQVECPIFFAICGKDTVAPAKASRSYAERAKRGTVKWYGDMGHFDIYVGDKHQQAFQDYEAFLKQHLPT